MLPLPDAEDTSLANPSGKFYPDRGRGEVDPASRVASGYIPLR